MEDDLRKDMELVRRPSAGRISSNCTTFLALNSVTACWLYAEMPWSTAIAVATASLQANRYVVTLGCTDCWRHKVAPDVM